MQNDYYTRGEKEFLLKIARATLEKYLRENDKFEPQTVNQKLWEKRGVFVTLVKGGNLRGCIGLIEPKESLILSVRDNTINAANDPRFEPLREDELDKTKIEISILTEPIGCRLEEIKNGDGVVIKCGDNQATYLPQVWEDLPDKDNFFSSLCLKAGLDSRAYLDPTAEFSKYNAIVFREGEI